MARVLSCVGRPFFFVFYYLVTGVLFVFFVVWKGISKFLGKLYSIKFVPTKRIKKKKIKIKFVKAKKRRVGKLNYSKIIIPVLVAGSIMLAIWFMIFRDLPSPKELSVRNQEVSTKIYDRNGTLLYKIYKDKNRTPIKLSSLPDHVIKATLAAEDAEFYQHFGFSIKGISRAIVRNLKSGTMAGGSTITQQLIKNTLLTPEKTLIRKVKELVLSIETEVVYSKDQILEMYLNEVPYGGTAYGIEEASQMYFGKSAVNLTLPEAAYLAGLPKSPSKYSPYSDPVSAKERQQTVLNLMAVNGYVSQNEANFAKYEEIKIIPNKIEIKAPHFVMYVKQILAQRYGEEVIETGGLEVVTTLDYNIQKKAEEIVNKEINSLKAYRVGNGAVIVLDPETGEILAMVGSKDYFDSTVDGQFNITTSLRQPGSSIKVVNYAYALGNGYTPASIIDDSPVSFVTPGSETYSPKNYDGKFRGKISLRSALAESRNIPAVKILASYGVKNMINLGTKMGITSWNDPGRFGLSLTLGGGEVRLTELAMVYATIANMGVKPELNDIISVSNYQGKVLYANTCIQDNFPLKSPTPSFTVNPFEKTCENKGEQILEETVAYQLIDILKDNSARAPAFGLNSQLVIKNHPEVAVKTGTSNDLKDNLTVGFTKDYLVAVWVGNNDNTPMSRIASGVTGAAPIWNKIMSYLLENKQTYNWDVPEKMVKVKICSYTGTLPCEGCPSKEEWFKESEVPTKHCSKESVQQIIEENNKILEGASTDINSQFPSGLMRQFEE